MSTHAPELIVHNADLMTVDRRRPRASCMAVAGGRILAVGEADVLALKGPHTRLIDAQGKTIVPGFCDSHLHLLWYGSQLLKQADLVGTKDVADLQARLGAQAARSGQGWIQGHGFDQSKIAERRFPTRDELDAVSGGRPILISRVCGHAVIVNSAALALATPDERAAGDERTGLYTEGAGGAFYKYVPPLSEDEMEQSVLLAAQVALRTGITSVQTLLDTPEQMIGYARLRRKGKLPIRVVGMPPWSAVEQLHAHGVSTTFGDDWLRFGAAKLFSDGSLGAQTAWMKDPYADKPDTRGLRIYDPEDLKRRARIAQEKGFQLAIHAIGDQAVRETLDAIEHALGDDDNGYHRHRIEHASVCPPDCLERMARRRIVVTLQPQFVTSDTWTPDRVGPARVKDCYPFKTMLKMGIPVGLGSDCPVEKLDAFDCLAAAVGRHPWTPDETLSVEEAIEAYTLGSAYCAHTDDRQGSLTPGKLADFVILSASPRAMTADQLRTLKADRVFVGGVEARLP